MKFLSDEAKGSTRDNMKHKIQLISMYTMNAIAVNPGIR